MTDLRNVWVCGAGLELVRADRIVSVYASDSRRTYQNPAPRSAAGSSRELSLNVVLAAYAASGGDGEPEVTLGTCPGNQIVPWMVSLVDALHEAGRDDDAGPVFICPHTDPSTREPVWARSDGLPDDWAYTP